MKKLLPILGLLALGLVALTGCGMKGSVYVKVGYGATDSSGTHAIQGALISLPGFPSNAAADGTTEWLVTPGVYAGKYVVYWSEFVSGTHLDPPVSGQAYSNHYHVHYSSGYYSWGPDVLSAVAAYQPDFTTPPDSTYYGVVNYTLTAITGPSPTTPGADKRYVMTLDWTPANSTVVAAP